MSQELTNQQELLRERFTEGNYIRDRLYTRIEDLGKRVRDGCVHAPDFGLKVLHECGVFHVETDGPSRVTSITNFSGCTIISRKDYAPIQEWDDKRGRPRPDQFMISSAQIEVFTSVENQEGLNACTSYLNGRGYIELIQVE